MDRLIFSFPLLFLAFFIQIGNAQTGSSSQSSLPEEVLKMTLSDDFVVSGSGVFYQILVKSNKTNAFSKISKAAEVGLYNTSGERVLIQKVLLNEGIGNGKIFIRPSLPSGAYYLIAVTNWSMNNKEHAQFAKKDLIILNPFQNNDLNASQDSISIKYNSKEFSNLSEKNSKASEIALKTDKEAYGLREKVELIVESGISYQDPFTVSVSRVKPIEIVKPTDEREIVISSNQTFVPEVRGSSIQGAITSTNENLNVANQVIALSIPGKKYVFKVSRTDAKGQFLFYLDENEYKYEDLNIYVMGPNREDYQVELKNSVLDHISPEKKMVNLQIDEELKEWIEFKSTAIQIENAYFETKADSLISRPIKDPFYAPLGFVYKLDEYTRFRTVEETFVEVISRAAVRKEGDNYIFKAYNFTEEEKIAGIDKLHPLILIDGTVIEDNNILVNYNAEKIEKITVVPDNYRYGSELFAGIIDVTTIDGNYGENSNLRDFEFLYPNLEVAGYQPDYSSNNNLSRIPDYRTSLFWDYNISLKKNSPINFEFYTSDIEGWYEIELKGYNNRGELLHVSQYFKVE